MAAATLTLQQAQQYTRDWGATRRTPFGLPIPRLALPVTVFGSATGLVYGTQALLLTFQTKANWFFVAVGVVLGFQGGGNAPGPGDVQYTVDIDAPLVNPADPSSSLSLDPTRFLAPQPLSNRLKDEQ